MRSRKRLQIFGEMRRRGVALIGREPQRLADDGVEIAGESRAQTRHRGCPRRGGGSSISADWRAAACRDPGSPALRPATRAARRRDTASAPVSNSCSTTPSEYTSVSVEMRRAAQLLGRRVQRRHRRAGHAR